MTATFRREAADRSPAGDDRQSLEAADLSFPAHSRVCPILGHRPDLYQSPFESVPPEGYDNQPEALPQMYGR